MSKIWADRHYVLFVIAAVIFLMTENVMYIQGYLYSYGFIFGVFSAVLFFAYALVYLLSINGRRKNGKLLDIIFILSLINFIAMFAFSGPISNYLTYYTAETAFGAGLSAVLIIAVAFPLFLAAYLIREKHLMYIGLALLAIVVVLLVVYFLSGIFIKYYTIDDEIFISIRELHYFLAGMNPYQSSVAQQVYYNSSIVGFTQTTNNQIIGVLNYPALYMLAFLPFYLTIHPSIYNIEHHILPIQGAVFFIILLFAIAFSIDKEHLKTPVFGLVVLIALGFSLTSSPVDFLLIALLVVAYKKIGTKYSWLLIGLCVSIQELLWVPALLFLVYSVNNYGFRKGAYDFLGAAAVFLLVNGYFIARGPVVFFSSIFDTVKNLLPIGTSAFGFPLLANYHIPLSAYMPIFLVVVALVILFYSYFNKKALLGLFSLVPFLFLSRSLVSYYAIFVTLTFVALFIKDGNAKKGVIEGYLKKRKLMFFSVVALLSLAVVAIVYASHATYVRNFNMDVFNQSVHYSRSTNETVYSADLDYRNMSNDSFYVMFFGYGNRTFSIIGIFNSSVINNSVSCVSSDIQCTFNVNKIVLNGRNGKYHIVAYFKNESAYDEITDLRLVAYSGTYVYIGGSVSDASNTAN
jgi:hypothetical protein